MIDRRARNELAELLRRYAGGQIPNDEFEEAVPQSHDRAIAEIFSRGVWPIYDDTRKYRLVGKYALSKSDKSIVSRWVLFLKSDYEYQWPVVPLRKRLFWIASLGLFGQSARQAWQAAGEPDAWPFLNNSEFEQAKRRHGYLGKTGA